MFDPIDQKKKPVSYNLFKNFNYAFTGIYFGLRYEKNLWFQLIIGIFATTVFLNYEKTGYAIFTVVMMFLVSALELMNTAFEHLCDLVDTNHNPKIARIKDVSAGAVLYAALGWLLVIGFGFAQIYFNFRVTF
jgi:diacylglycerol kinase